MNNNSKPRLDVKTIRREETCDNLVIFTNRDMFFYTTRLKKLSAWPDKSKKCLYPEFLWFVFSRIRTEYGPEKLPIRALFTQ